VQQMQPLFISKDFLVGAPRTSSLSMPISAELVDDDRVFLAVRLGQDAVEKRRLAGAEIAGEHGDRNFCRSWGYSVGALYRGSPGG